MASRIPLLPRAAIVCIGCMEPAEPAATRSSREAGIARLQRAGVLPPETARVTTRGIRGPDGRCRPEERPEETLRVNQGYTAWLISADPATCTIVMGFGPVVRRPSIPTHDGSTDTVTFRVPGERTPR